MMSISHGAGEGANKGRKVWSMGLNVGDSVC